uniref:Ig-like domain-containing protein n=1 Tax=Oryzias melastigma TaxID=30732 RepID=A0A3B3C2R6_ORYME
CSDQCPSVFWMYRRNFIDDYTSPEIISFQGKINQSLPRASRMSVTSNCSLLIRNLHSEDAGLYGFGLAEFLEILSSDNCSLLIRNLHSEDAGLYGCAWISVSDLSMFLTTLDSEYSDVSGRVDLICSVKYFHKPCGCEQNSIIWMDETGSQLTGKGVGFEFRGQTHCVSILTLKHQSGSNKKFTCQFIEDDKVKIDAVYVGNFSGKTVFLVFLLSVQSEFIFEFLKSEERFVR